MTSPHEVIAAVRAQVLAERSACDYDELRTRLDELPDPVRRRRPWRQASILLDLAHRQRPSLVHRQLTTMRRRLAEDDATAEFDEFWSSCLSVLDGSTLGAHGYRVALSSLDPDLAWDRVAGVVAALEQRGLAVFINSGTLLGVVREGGFIGHDDDVDLAVVVEGADAGEVATAWWELRAQLLADGLLDEAFERRAHLHAKARVAGVGVDLFPAWVLDRKVWVWPHTPGVLDVGQVLPVERREVNGARVPLPRVPEPMLELNYGPNWRTPDPTWTFEWPGPETPTPFRPWITAMRPDGPPDRSG